MHEETNEEVKKVKKVKEPVKFTAEQLSVVQEMIAQSVRPTSANADDSVSVYGQRDPKSIISVNVKRVFGKFVVGFKDVQKDPLKKNPKYLEYEFDPIRKLDRQPYITLILSGDGEEVEEKKMLLVDYYNERESYEAKVLNIDLNKQVIDGGLLGRNSAFAREIDGQGHILARTKVRAESMQEKRTFTVELPGFNSPAVIADDFLA